jgi:hypothetical protein
MEMRISSGQGEVVDAMFLSSWCNDSQIEKHRRLYIAKHISTVANTVKRERRGKVRSMSSTFKRHGFPTHPYWD